MLDCPAGLSGISQRRHGGLLEAQAVDGVGVCLCVGGVVVLRRDIRPPPPGRKAVQYCRAPLSLHPQMWQIFLALQHLT